MTLTEMIQACIEAKKGDLDFALFYTDHDQEWDAHIGNTSQCVGLGEVPGEYHRSGKTPEEAVSRLLEILVTGKPSNDTVEEVRRGVFWEIGRFVDLPRDEVCSKIAARLDVTPEYVREVMDWD